MIVAFPTLYISANLVALALQLTSCFIPIVETLLVSYNQNSLDRICIQFEMEESDLLIRNIKL